MQRLLIVSLIGISLFMVGTVAFIGMRPPEDTSQAAADLEAGDLLREASSSPQGDMVIGRGYTVVGEDVFWQPYESATVSQLVDADSAAFRLLPFSNASGTSDYAVDGKSLFFYGDRIADDVASQAFVAKQVNGQDQYAVTATDVFFHSVRLLGADASTFTVHEEPRQCGADCWLPQVYDSVHTYHQHRILD